VREKDSPTVTQPFMKFYNALGGFSCEIRGQVA